MNRCKIEAASGVSSFLRWTRAVWECFHVCRETHTVCLMHTRPNLCITSSHLSTCHSTTQSMSLSLKTTTLREFFHEHQPSGLVLSSSLIFHGFQWSQTSTHTASRHRRERQRDDRRKTPETKGDGQTRPKVTRHSCYPSPLSHRLISMRRLLHCQRWFSVFQKALLVPTFLGPALHLPRHKLLDGSRRLDGLGRRRFPPKPHGSVALLYSAPFLGALGSPCVRCWGYTAQPDALFRVVRESVRVHACVSLRQSHCCWFDKALSGMGCFSIYCKS